MIIFVTVLYFVASSCNARPNNIDTQNMVTVPTNCPAGQEWVNGACREIWRVSAAPVNVITVPQNCPPGQSFINGQCREIWIKSLIPESNQGDIQPEYSDLSPQNVVTVPPNCRPGQQWINGACRDVWRSGFDSQNVITVPPNCPAGQEYINGECREVWRSLQMNIDYSEGQADQNDANRNIITVPSQCPVGYRPDALGNCRPIFQFD